MKRKAALAGSCLRWLIPTLSLLVVIQAVLLVQCAKGKTAGKSQPAYIPVPALEEKKEAAIKLAFVPAGASLKKGETLSVDLMLSPKRGLRLDGLDLVLSFNPQILQVVQLTTPKLFSSVTESRGKEENGRIYLTFLEEKTGGLWLDKEVKLLTLAIKGKAVGEGEIAVVSEGEIPATVVTESGTSKKTPFDQGKTKLVVYQ